jgi:hypothetical protein
MLARSFLAAGLFFQMTLILEAQFVQQPVGQMTPMQQQQQQRLQRHLQQQGMQQGMQQGLQPGMQQGLQQGMQGVPFDATGTLEAIGSGRIKIIDSAGNERILIVNQQTTVKTTGEATAEFLKPGLCVEFTAEVDAKGKVSTKVDELSIVTVTKEKPAGVFSESGEAIKPASNSKAKKGEAPASATGKVVGHIKSVKLGKIQVQAGSRTVLFELGDNPKITVELADGSLAAKGDKVEVKGLQSPTTPNQGQAQSVTITLAEPLGEKKKSDASKLDPKNPPKALKPKKSDKAGGLPVPAEDK